jgi:adenosylmethionine-8-amino-7-oxononanoate aminotransferase
MSVSGNVTRRAPYAPLLAEWGHIAPCFCYHCPFGAEFPDCGIACADDSGQLLRGDHSETASAFIFEPVVGATLGAAPPPDGYAQRIAQICREQGILLIADEIMTGMGRTGKPFAVNHWNVEPDLILVGKGVAGGYAPLGAVLVSARVAEAFKQGSGRFSMGLPIRRIRCQRPQATPFSTIWSGTSFSTASCRRPQNFARRWRRSKRILMQGKSAGWGCCWGSSL